MKRTWAALALSSLLALGGCAGDQAKPSGAGSRAAGSHDDISQPQSRRYRDASDSVPAGSFDVSKLAEPVPKLEPRSRYGNKSPYTVRGHTYHVLPTARGYDERGIASYYGNKFHGYKTSSMETYDMYAFSAASTTLPLPSYVRVTNLDNGKSVVVRVNDRGPFHQNRLIDLSYAAAVKIGIWPKGLGLVEVVGIDPAHPSQELSRPVAVRHRPGIYLQAGAFADPANAAKLARRLRAAKLGTVQTSDVLIDGRRLRRVRVGPLSSVERADEVSERIEDMGLPRPEVAVD